MSRELILDKGTMIVSETDARGNIIYVNDEFCKYAGYSKDELIGKPHNIVRHPDMPSLAFKSLWDTIKSDSVWSGIVKNRAKDGEYYWVHATVFPKVDAKGNKKIISVRQKANTSDIKEAQSLYSTLN
jgi:aerotaxis receptor